MGVGSAHRIRRASSPPSQGSVLIGLCRLPLRIRMAGGRGLVRRTTLGPRDLGAVRMVLEIAALAVLQPWNATRMVLLGALRTRIL